MNGYIKQIKTPKKTKRNNSQSAQLCETNNTFVVKCGGCGGKWHLPMLKYYPLSDKNATIKT